jgi:DNA-binding transcriptional LysR family regulator
MPFRRGQLDYFVAVVEDGQFTRAASRLHIAQPALSKAIAQLEAELGVKLLERHARGVTLTPAGEQFYEKARLAVAAASDAMQTAESLTRVQEGTIEFGFIGAPPGLDSPAPLEAFAQAHPQIDIRYRELHFPSAPTASWLADVDVAVCHVPPADPGVWAQPLRLEPRVVLAPSRHPLAGRRELSVAEVLDETFIGFDPFVEPDWAGFWSLDDHRGGAPRSLTADHAGNPQEVLASLSVRSAITTVPASVAAILANVLSGVVAIPLRDAAPAAIMLVGRQDRRNPLVVALLAFAGTLRGGVEPERGLHPLGDARSGSLSPGARR